MIWVEGLVRKVRAKRELTSDSDSPRSSSSTFSDDAIGILRVRLVDDGEQVIASLAAD
jgi:hypothetical protein